MDEVTSDANLQTPEKPPESRMGCLSAAGDGNSADHDNNIESIAWVSGFERGSFGRRISKANPGAFYWTRDSWSV